MNSYRWIDANEVSWGFGAGSTNSVDLQAGAEGFKDLETDSFERDAALSDGQVFSGWRARPRAVLLPVVINGNEYNTFEDTRKVFRDGMRPGRYGTLQVTSTDDVRTLTARFVREVNPGNDIDPLVMGYEMATFVLIADDPWWHGAAVSKTMQTPETPRPFFEPGPTHVLNIMSSNTVASASLENPGDVAAWPTIRIDGPSTGFSFADANGEAVAGSIVVDSGEWLIVDLSPLQQTALLYSAPSTLTDVTNELTQFNPRPIPVGTTADYTVQLNGAGSMTVSIEPRYFRAF